MGGGSKGGGGEGICLSCVRDSVERHLRYCDRNQRDTLTQTRERYPIPWCGGSCSRRECDNPMAARWTELEDEQIRTSARQGWPDLAVVARILGRSHGAVRARASRLGAVREFRQRPPAAARACLYCGATMIGRGRAVYCSQTCKILKGGHCTGCGRPWRPGGECLHCAAIGKRSRWPGPAAGVVA